MKKLSTLFLGLVIALSAVAAPQFSRTKTVRDFTAIQKHEKKIAKTQAKANGEVIKIEANNLTIDASWLDYGMVFVSGGTDEWYADCGLYPEGEDIYTTYSSEADNISIAIYHNDEDYIEVTVSEAEMTMTENGPKFTAITMDEQGTTYEILLTFFAPSEPKDTISIEFGPVTFFKYYAEDNDYYFSGENAEYVATFDIVTNQLAGTYTYDDFIIEYTRLFAINDGDTTYVGGVFDAKANIVENDGVFDINTELFLADSILYKMHLTYTKPVASDTINYTFEEPVMIDDFSGDFYFRAIDDNYALLIDYYSTSITGEFKLADMYEEYCGLYTIANGDTTFVPFADLGLVVTEDETNYNITVTYLAEDTHCYIFTLRSEKPKADETVQVEFENAEYTDVSSIAWYYGFYHYVLAATPDSSLVFSLAVKEENFEGSFTQADLHGNYTGVQADGNFYQIASAEFTVTPGNKGNYLLQGWALAKNNVKYEFVIKTAEEEEQGIENIELTEDVKKVVMDGNLFIVRDGKIFNAQGIRVR